MYVCNQHPKLTGRVLHTTKGVPVRTWLQPDVNHVYNTYHMTKCIPVYMWSYAQVCMIPTHTKERIICSLISVAASLT